MRTGISITLSRNQLEVSDPAGYQKPKPRQFMQPMPRYKPQAEEKEEDHRADDDLRKKKQRRAKAKSA